jgi:flagellar basal-body rod protein FlgB
MHIEMHMGSTTMTAVERALDGLSARHAAHANNNANHNTPGYVKREVNFEQSLLAALDDAHKPSAGAYASMSFDGMDAGADVTVSHNNPLLQWKPVTTLSADGPQRLDGNRTSIETEISKMAYNSVKYNALSGVIAKDYQLLRTIAQAK